jgi:hypothetical protein
MPRVKEEGKYSPASRIMENSLYFNGPENTYFFASFARAWAGPPQQ